MPIKRFSNELNINYQINENGIVQMRLIEIGSGKLFYSGELKSNENNFKLSTENFVSEVYLINLTKKGEAPVYYKLVNLK